MLVVLFLASSLIAFVPGRAVQLCGAPLTHLLNDICSYKHESKPCFKSPLSRLTRFYATMKVMNLCCDRECSIEDIFELCCLESECLTVCYPHRDL